MSGNCLRPVTIHSFKIDVLLWITQLIFGLQSYEKKCHFLWHSPISTKKFTHFNYQSHSLLLADLRGLSTDKICRASRCHTKKEGGEIILRPRCLSVQAVVLRLLLQECFSLYTLSSCRAISCHDRHPHIRSQHQPSLPGHLRYNP